jgi:hypothetical protein
MAYNHYAKMKRILEGYDGWVIRRIDKPTTATKFNGEIVQFDHFYRAYDAQDQPINYCKFQQLDRFAQIMNTPIEELPILED